MIMAVLPALSAGIRLGLSTLHILLSDVYFIFCSLIMRCLGGVILLCCYYLTFCTWSVSKYLTDL